MLFSIWESVKYRDAQGFIYLGNQDYTGDSLISGLLQDSRYLFSLTLQLTVAAWQNARLALSILTSFFHPLWVHGSLNPTQLAFHFLQPSLYCLMKFSMLLYSSQTVTPKTFS